MVKCTCGCGKKYDKTIFATCRKCGHRWTANFACAWWTIPCPKCKDLDEPPASEIDTAHDQH